MMLNRLRIALLALSLTASAVAQTQFASVRGQVEDSSGAVVSNATLTLTNVDQNRPWTTISNDKGYDHYRDNGRGCDAPSLCCSLGRHRAYRHCLGVDVSCMWVHRVGGSQTRSSDSLNMTTNAEDDSPLCDAQHVGWR
jgi:hypothetical protein